MRFRLSVLCGALALVTAPRVAPGQQIPQLPPGVTPEQARQLLEQRPELGALLRERIRQSGLSPDEIRTMLRGAGYPGNLLDMYLTADTAAVPPDPSRTMLSVVSRLGLAQLSRRDSLLLTGDTLAFRMHRDSLRADSIARTDSLAASRRGVQLFGLEAFRQATTRFQPVVTGPVDDSYVLGPGDQLVLILTGEVEIARQLEVTRGGFIVIPDVGQIHVNGITLGQLRDVLYDRLGRVYSGVSRRPDPRTRFEVTVAGVRLHALRVVGEVARPGTYQIAATGSVLSAIYEAGGLTERANFRDVQVRRGAQLVATVDLYDYLLHGIVPSEVALASGDVIFVPVRGPRVTIAGEVTRPAIYELRRGETLRDLVQIAGGLTPRAATANVTIDRLLPPEQREGPDFTRTVVTVDLGVVLAGTGAPVPLYAGDSVTIFPIRSGRRNAITIAGDGVWQPGTYQLEPGMRLSDLIRIAGGLRPDVYQGRAQVLRTYSDSTQRFLGAHLAQASAPFPQPDLELRELDQVTVYARTEFRPDRRVAVYGAVQKPGQVAYADSLTLRDAVLLAGGITEDASLIEAEISRLQAPGGDSLAVVLRVPLDSSYVVDETALFTRAVGARSAPEVVLHPYDNVLIRRLPGFERPRTVVVSGEVRYPGTYTLLLRDERLASVLQRAGGLTEQAYVNGIRFFRPLLPDTLAAPASRDTLLRRTGVTDPRLGPDFGAPTGPRPLMTRVGVDLERVLRDPSHPHNLVLEQGDSIHVPRFISVVRVEGSVHSPGTVPYRRGAGVGHYVDGAGGATRDADKGRTYVQQPNGLIQKGGDPQPGAVVVVPEQVRAEPGTSFVQIMGALAPLISAATTIVVILATR